MTNDRSTTEEFQTIRDAAEASFAELAREHDRLIAKACEHYAINAATHASNLAAVIKAIMLFRFPEASDAWFGA